MNKIVIKILQSTVV